MSAEQTAPFGQTAASETKFSRRVRADKVSGMQTDDFVCIEPTTPLSAAIEAMKKDEGGCAIVCEGERVVGIFTERDLLTKIVGHDVDMQAPVSNWMSPASCRRRICSGTSGRAGAPGGRGSEWSLKIATGSKNARKR